MGFRCTVCAHSQVRLINDQLPSVSILRLAAQFGVTRDALMRHRDRHTQAEAIRIESPPQEHRTSPEYTRARRRNGPSPTARQLFLDAYRTSGNITEAAAAAGTTRTSVRRWQEQDDEFALAFQQAEIEAVEALEAEARVRATKGAKVLRRVIRGGRLIEEVEEWRPSDAMLIKLLQALRPEKYGERLSVTQTTIVKTIDSEAWDAV
jgi:hypothetical protein